MKTIILAGGLGSRLQEETTVRPKPMVEIGGHPILWHILNIYGSHGFNDFIIALGYKGEYIKQYFSNFTELNDDFTINLSTGIRQIHSDRNPKWNVSLIDTGINSHTGGRLRRLKNRIGNETFMVTYGDGLANVDIKKLVEFHRSHGKIATVSAVKPPARFGGLRIDKGKVIEFAEKPKTGEGWINGGFFVFEPKVLDYIDHDGMPLEKEPLERLTRDNQLMAFEHDGFFQPMDTLREKQILEELWNTGTAPWKNW